MTIWRARLTECRELLAMTAPVALGQAGGMLLTAADLAVAGRLGGQAAATVGLALAWRTAALIMAQGAAAGLAPVLKRAEGRADETRRILFRGWMILAALAAGVMLWLLGAETAFRLLGQSSELAREAGAYARVLALSVVPFVGFYFLQAVLRAAGRFHEVTVVIYAANGVNLALNLILSEGRFGAPLLGTMGVAWSTVFVGVFLCGCCFGLAAPELRRMVRAGAGEGVPVRMEGGATWSRMAGRMLPVGGQYAAEVAAFSGASVVAAALGTDALAAHAVVQNIMSLAFGVPMGIGEAAAMRTAERAARGEDGRRSCLTALGLAAPVMTATAACLILAPLAVARRYTETPEVLALLAKTLPVLGVMHLFDGAQVVMMGVLRGRGDVAVPSAWNIGLLWGLGLPAAWALSLPAGYGLPGLWAGLTLAVALLAAALAFRLRRALSVT